jgi:hypothetical protein
MIRIRGLPLERFQSNRGANMNHHENRSNTYIFLDFASTLFVPSILLVTPPTPPVSIDVTLEEIKGSMRKQPIQLKMSWYGLKNILAQASKLILIKQ